MRTHYELMLLSFIENCHIRIAISKFGPLNKSEFTGIFCHRYQLFFFAHINHWPYDQETVT